MEQQRPLLFIALAIVLFLLWDAWQRDFGPQPEPRTTQQTDQAGDSRADRADVPMGADESETPAQSDSRSADVPSGGGEGRRLLESGSRIEVVTDVFRAEIDTVGGDLRRVELLEYPVTSDRPDEPVVLMNDSLPNLFVSQSGFTAKRQREGDDSLIEAPNHYSRYQAKADRYRLREGQDQLSVDLVWKVPKAWNLSRPTRSPAAIISCKWTIPLITRPINCGGAISIPSYSAPRSRKSTPPGSSTPTWAG